MDHLRILLAVRPPLLRDTLHTLLAGHGRFLVMDEEPRNIDILVGARRRRVDVVVANIEPASDVPPLVTHLLAEFPELLVVGISQREQSAWIYRHDEVRTIGELTVSGIFQAILQGASRSNDADED